jgi:hypothetical protein
MNSKILIQDAREAAADLSAATLQFSMVKLDADGKVVAVAATTDKPLGVLLNSPKLGEVAEICTLGKTKLRVGAADLARDTLLGTDATGRGATAASGQFVIGRVDEVYSADNDGAILGASVNFLNLTRAVVAGG